MAHPSRRRLGRACTGVSPTQKAHFRATFPSVPTKNVGSYNLYSYHLACAARQNCTHILPAPRALLWLKPKPVARAWRSLGGGT